MTTAKTTAKTNECVIKCNPHRELAVIPMYRG